MKQIILYSLLAFSFSCYSKAVPSNYTIVRSEQDKALKKTEALFALTFYGKNATLINKEITFSYNATEKKETPNTKGEIFIEIKPGKYAFSFFLDMDHYEITTDSILIKPGYKTEIQVNFRSSIEQVPMKKPVIYVYPIKKEKVSIKLDLKGEFSFTYPEYKNGWDFIAEPDGTIEMNNKKYHYLFWDGNLNIETSKLNLNDGFIVSKKDLVNFFEEKLTVMGLNTQEIEDYITYWCPLMSINEKNYIHFMYNEEYGHYASITIDPKPDYLFRVCMLWSKANNKTIIKPQKIESFKRSGFTVVEWGGSELTEKINLN
ncbi:MAG: hypothetical protein ABIP51_05835 [Bacteroidia bacterium]